MNLETIKEALYNLHRGAEMGDVQQMLKGLKSGASINDVNKHGYTALMLNALARDSDSLRFILSKNPDLNKINAYGKTALMLFVGMGRWETLNILLEHMECFEKEGGVIHWDQQDSNGETALMYMITDRHKDLEAALSLYSHSFERWFKQPMNLNLKNNEGKTLEDMAKNPNQRLLLEKIKAYQEKCVLESITEKVNQGPGHSDLESSDPERLTDGIRQGLRL